MRQAVILEGEYNPIDAPVRDIEHTWQRIEHLTAELRRRDAAIKSQHVLIASLQEKLAAVSKEFDRLGSDNTQAELRSSLEQLRRENALLRQEAAKVRNTISYQLGYALIHAFKSWSAAIALPRTVMTIHLEAKRRERLKAASGMKLNARDVSPPPSNAVGTLPAGVDTSTKDAWCHPYAKLQVLEKTSPISPLFVIGSSLGNPAHDAVALTPQNFEHRISHSNGSTVRVYFNRNLAESGWGRLFDFDEMQSFKRFIELRRLVRKRGGRVEIVREDDAMAPLLTYVGD